VLEPVFEACRLSRQHPNGLGIVDVDLSLAPGELVGLVGPNGSGKTTLLRVAATANAPTAGSARWFGIPDRRSPEVRRRLGVMLDTAVHFDRLSGWQNAYFFAARYGLDPVTARRRLADLFDWADISDARDLPVAQYSLGMRRRLGLLEAIVHMPDLLVLDEPSLALDHRGELDLESRLATLAAGGTAVLVATNDPRLSDLCQRLVHVERGRIRAEDRAA
jgi:ABC-2 type transport system ATP-binding protein